VRRVTTNADLDAALRTASESEVGVYVEVVTDTYAASALARKLGEAVQTLYK
jgi:indolepyruvate decarboxylase